jgi:hypothetical protein
MIIEKLDPSRDVESDVSLEGSVLIIAKVAVDLAAEEADSQVVITISRHDGVAVRGSAVGGEYVADIVIPPRRYKTVEGTGTDGNPTTSSEAIPLDLDAVTLRLWPIAA